MTETKNESTFAQAKKNHRFSHALLSCSQKFIIVHVSHPYISTKKIYIPFEKMSIYAQNSHKANPLLHIAFQPLQPPFLQNEGGSRSDNDSIGLLLHLVRLADDLVRRSLHDPASPRKLSPNTHEVGIHISGSLTTFVDTPIGKAVSNPYN